MLRIPGVGLPIPGRRAYPGPGSPVSESPVIHGVGLPIPDPCLFPA